MKNRILFLLTLILSISSYSQISFERGYYIDNSNQKIYCLIKAIDWNNNPTVIEVKLSENEDSKKVAIDFVKEFEVINSAKYIRCKVNIDRSTNRINNLSYDKNPLFNEEVLFLEVLVEGESNLYQYYDKGLIRFFYNKKNGDVEQLIFKSYRTVDDLIAQNNKFREQLWVDLKCMSFDMTRMEKIKYEKKDLMRLFTDYSKCSNSDLLYSAPKIKRDFFNLSIRPRLNNSSLLMLYLGYKPKDVMDFGNKTSFGIGLESEIILPINKNKWAVVFEPTYQSFNGETANNDISSVVGGTINSKVSYRSIELPLSLRYYFIVSKNSKIFINVSAIYDWALKSTMEFENPTISNTNTYNINKTGGNYGFGMGYKVFDKYSVEMRYQTSRDLLVFDSSWVTDYKTFSVIFGYTLF